MTSQQHVTKKAMMNTVVEAYRDGALVAGPIAYAGHPENAQHLARRMAVESGADLVRVLDEFGERGTVVGACWRAVDGQGGEIA